jgi:hypothetical protein
MTVVRDLPPGASQAPVGAYAAALPLLLVFGVGLHDLAAEDYLDGLLPAAAALVRPAHRHARCATHDDGHEEHRAEHQPTDGDLQIREERDTNRLDELAGGKAEGPRPIETCAMYLPATK